ncbi:Tn3 family transposase [Pseudovibrio denitrificans]|uniref:Tn3 family transposase n=1 Tax=Pseudovibrio denitrificans TaxID=258256 RepID=UPI0039BFFB16
MLSDRQRAALFDLPTDKQTLLRYYTLADDDIQQIQLRRQPQNKFGFALQLCAFRYLGRLLSPGEVIPAEITEFIAAQLGINPTALTDYGHRSEMRREHLADLRAAYGYRVYSGRSASELRTWLTSQAEKAKSNVELATKFVEACRERQILLPGVSVIERLCADALVAAERQIDTRIVNRLDAIAREQLDSLLFETTDGRVSHLVWLRRFEVGNNSAGASRLLDRLEFLQAIELQSDVLEGVPPHRITRLRRQGERYFTDGLLDISSDRRLAILAACVLEWQAAISDALVETHDRIVGKTWRVAKKLCEAQVDEAKASVQQTLRSYTELGSALLIAREDGISLETIVSECVGWLGREELVVQSTQLTDTVSTEPLAHVVQGYNRFRRYVPRMLKALDIKAAPVAIPLLEAAKIISTSAKNHARKRTFLRSNSKWHRYLKIQTEGDYRLWEVAVLFHLRDAFRSGDIWLAHSKRYADLKDALAPISTVQNTPRLAVPFEAQTWLADRQARLDTGLKRLAAAARQGLIPNGSIENGILQIERLTAAVPDEADKLVLDLYNRLPDIRITDLLLEVDQATGFSEAFTHLRTGAPCKDKIGLLNVLLAEGLNLGLSKMAEACDSHDYYQLSRLSRWHIESEALNRALAMVIKAQAQLPMARCWGAGLTASSYGQFFPAAHQSEAMNLINAKYGSESGLKAYTHVSDQFCPFATQTIPATVSEAPYILDGLLMNETGRRIKEQYADTGGFTDHVFAVSALLGYSFIPRIRDLPSKRLYVFDPSACTKDIKGLIGGKIRQDLIIQNWPDILRVVATMIAGRIPPSQLLKKFASYPRQHELAVALREVGRLERTLFVLEWLLDTDMQCRALIGLNKGEAHHALKNALRIGRQGEIRDRTAEGQHYCIAGLNLLAAIIIHWNTDHLGQAVSKRKLDDLDCPPELLAHISPLGWAHILLTGEYRWRKR